MEWTDDAIVLSARRHGESAVILELLTRDHGRHLGLVHGGGSRKLRPVLQPGNGVSATWRARLDEQLGSFTIEPDRSRVDAYLGSPMALAGLATLTALLRLLPERDPHPGLHAETGRLLDDLADPRRAPVRFVRFEMRLLAEMGFGLDLSVCAATGLPDDLVYVSPRTGRAVSRAAGEPYRDRLLRLPAFLGRGGEAEPIAGSDALAEAFRLTGFFLATHALGLREAGITASRDRFVALALASAAL